MLNNNDFYLHLKAECQRIGKSINQVERELGYPRNSLHNYKFNRIPSGKRLLEISDYFNVSPNYLLGEASEDKENVNYMFKKLNLNEKKELYYVFQEWLSSLVEEKY